MRLPPTGARPPGTETTLSLAVYAERIRRRWVLLVVLVLTAAAAAAAGTLLQPPEYTGRAALAIVSQNRAPEQDAVLGRGYVDLFNQPSLQQELARRTGLGPDVRFDARLAADSPILYIEATAHDPEVAARAATVLATTYRDDVRNNLTGDRVRAAQDLTAQLDAARAKLDALPADSPERAPVADAIGSLQSRLSTVQANTSNQLTDLQLDAGVTQDAAGLVRTVALAALGGLALGLVLALGLGRTERRLTSAAEVRDRLRRDVVATVDPDALATDATGAQLRPLADLLALPDLPVPGSIAVAVAGREGGAPVSAAARTAVATALASVRARQHGSVLLLRTDPDPRGDGRPGVADFLDRRAAVDLSALVVHHGPDGSGVPVVPAGRDTGGGDAIARWSRDAVGTLLAMAGALAELVLVDASPVPANAAGLLVCGAAERTLLVVEQNRTRAVDAIDAIDRIERAGGDVYGVVLCRPSGRRSRPAAPAVEPAATRANHEETTARQHIPQDRFASPRPRPAPAQPRAGG